MAHSLALQWSLDHTADKFLKVGRDLIRAATIDNVQPLAIMACEQFGATLAICPMTRLKVERLIRSQTSSTAIKFLKATVGFANGGTILELSKNIAGLNFLALAAALVSVSTTFNAATMIQLMITASAADKTLIPTTYHLKDLLDVLEPQLNRVGFLVDVLGWKSWWSTHQDLSYIEQEYLREFGGAIPAPEGVLNIVAALREVSRVGEAKMVNLTIGVAVPWLTAFIKWCLGEPPTICTTAGQCLLDQERIPVKIIFSTEVTAVNTAGIPVYHELRIDIISAFKSFADVITSAESEQRLFAIGMVDIQSHAKGVLSLGRMDNDLRHSSLVQALPYALDQVRNNWQIGRRIQPNPNRPNVKEVFGPNAFPNDTVIASVMKRYLSLTEDVDLRSLPQNELIADLPILRAYTAGTGEMEHLLKWVSVIAADILSLSLFNGSLDSLQVYHDSSDIDRSERGFARKINEILHGSIQQSSNKDSLEAVLGWALELVKHDVALSLRENEWAGSSSHGQVVFPKLFEDRVLRSTGYLELFALPGVLTLPGQGSKPFPLVKGIPGLTLMVAGPEPEAWPGPLTRSLNLFPQEQLLWKVQPLEDCLSISMGWTRDFIRASPSRLLENVASAVFVNPCSHSDAEATNNSFNFRENVKVLELASRLEGVYGWKGVYEWTRKDGNGKEDTLPLTTLYTYPVAGNQGLRMLALAAVGIGEDGVSAIINNGACFECLLAQCNIANRPFIIL